MAFDPKYLINVFLAFLALCLYIIGSYRFYKNKNGFLAILGLALFIDVLTAILASFKITSTTQIPGTVSVPWHSILFNVHVILSSIGIIGFLLLYIYILIRNPLKYNAWIRKWQFLALLPIWTIGELIALTNALFKIFLSVRLFELI
jgi:hypothetical protein